MALSEFLEGMRGEMRELVSALKPYYKYVSVLATDCKSSAYRADKATSSVLDGAGFEGECGFVVRVHDGKAFGEYSASSIAGDKQALAKKIVREISLNEAKNAIECPVPQDPVRKASYVRESDFDSFSDDEVLSFLKNLKDEILKKDEKILNAIVILRPIVINKLFVSVNRELDQHYGWVNGIMVAVYRDGRIAEGWESAYGNQMKDVLATMPTLVDKLVDKVRHVANATPIEPGVYDIITDNSITGLIAHEAFGHGVEMDQFVKNRALAKEYVGKYVASPIVNMHDGAAAAFSTASYFFDDDGIEAHDTQIIKDGILVAGISDVASASQLGTAPTGNGRRENYTRKAYTRMTNTFFEPGKDKLEDMIKSVKHGYMLFETNNGMEDPKNWQIQCTAEYGIEIVDGKLTDHYVSPVVMSGFVPELLKSITMVSDNFEVIGAGSCGKGYKEWVRVSDGGPCLKARCKLS
ncbi:MAG: TldD/PmbA family protein [Clostridia bacterium]|nr:TldD/PmbA family protein [Clostridia bacterium]